MKILKESVKILKNKIIALLGFAAKSGSLCYGFESTVSAVRAGKAKGVFFASDISAKSRKEILFYSNRFSVRAFELKDMNITELSNATGKRCAVVAVTNNSFCKPIVSYLTSDV